MEQIIDLLEKMIDRRIEMYYEARHSDYRSVRNAKSDYDSLKEELIQTLIKINQ